MLKHKRNADPPPYPIDGSLDWMYRGQQAEQDMGLTSMRTPKSRPPTSSRGDVDYEHYQPNGSDSYSSDGSNGTLLTQTYQQPQEELSSLQRKRQQTFRVRDRVDAQCLGPIYSPGTIERVNSDRTYKVKFKNGRIKDRLKASLISKVRKPVSVGTCVTKREKREGGGASWIRVYIPTEPDAGRVRPFIYCTFKRADRGRPSKGFVKERVLVDTGAQRTAVTARVALVLRSQAKLRVAAVTTGAGKELRQLIDISITSKCTDKTDLTVDLTASVRELNRSHCILGMDWVRAARPRFIYKDLRVV